MPDPYLPFLFAAARSAARSLLSVLYLFPLCPLPCGRGVLGGCVTLALSPVCPGTRGGGLLRTSGLDSRVQGCDDVLRAQCLQHPEEILAVRWLRACEGQLFATVLHQSQQEVTMVAVSEGVATCRGRGICSIACPLSSSL